MNWKVRELRKALNRNRVLGRD